MNRRVIYALLGVAVILVVAGAVLYANTRAALTGSVIDPPWPAPELTLTDHNGAPFSLDAERGKVVLLYFGYVNCPDECPLTMAHLKLAMDSLSGKAQKVQVAMVSTDPGRDTPQALKDFMMKFDPSFLGLTGTQDQLGKAWHDYGVSVEDNGETHSVYLYVIDPRGSIRETFLPDSPPADIAADVNLLLSGR